MRRWGALAAALPLVASLAAAAPPPGWQAATMMPLAEVSPGMRGVGRTVFRGTSIDTFGVEVLGVLDTGLPRNHMILARVSGQGLERAGIVAGMSGSPVFVEGRLIGALAFGWPFSTEPIAGITPIEEMLDLGSRSAGDLGAAPRAHGLPPGTWNALWNTPADGALDLLIGRPDPGAEPMSPLQVPVAVSGFSGGGADLAERFLATRGFLPVQGGGGGDPAPGTGPVHLEPGSAVGVELIRGDASMAAIGTVTWVEGDRVLAFGHPMLSLGPTAYPMTEARILAVMPRLSTSFKLGVAGRTVGAITRDYATGVMGALGDAPHMIPIHLDLDFPERPETLDFQILDGEGLTPALVGVVATNCMQTLGRAQGAFTLRMRARVVLDSGRVVEISRVAAGFSPPTALAGDLARITGLLAGNPFQPVRLESIAVAVTVQDSIQAAFLDRVSVPPGPVHPGDAVAVTARLRDYRGETRAMEIPFALPADLVPGTYQLLACDSGQAARLDQERAPARYAPTSLDQVITLLEGEVPADHLVLRLVSAEPTPVVTGRELPRLPGSLRAVVLSPSASGAGGEAGATVVAERTVAANRILIGCQAVPLTVEEPR